MTDEATSNGTTNKDKLWYAILDKTVGFFSEDTGAFNGTNLASLIEEDADDAEVGRAALSFLEGQWTRLAGARAGGYDEWGMTGYGKDIIHALFDIPMFTVDLGEKLKEAFTRPVAERRLPSAVKKS